VSHKRGSASMGPRQGFANMAGSIVSNAASALIVGGFVMSYLIEQCLYAGRYSGARWVRCRNLIHYR
jgi:hypothetical protein